MAERATTQTSVLRNRAGSELHGAQSDPRHGCNLNDETSRGRAVLGVASIKGSVAVVKAVLDLCAEIRITDNHRYTPLNPILSNRYVEMLRHSLSCGSAQLGLFSPRVILSPTAHEWVSFY